MFAELKTHTGRVSPTQRKWLEIIDDGPADAYLWRPADLLAGRIATVLTAFDTHAASFPIHRSTR